MELSLDELLALYDNVLPAVEEQLNKVKISPWAHQPEDPPDMGHLLKYGPAGEPIPPLDLTKVSDVEIGQLHSLFTAWSNYYTTEATAAQCRFRIFEQKARMIKSYLNIKLREETTSGNKVPVGLIPDYIAAAPEVVQLDSELLKAELLFKSVNSQYQKYHDFCKCISREQTRRGEEYFRNNHDERGGTKTSSPPPRWRN